jgi:hypothetical protein
VIHEGEQIMAKRASKWMTKAAFLALGIVATLSTSSPSWAEAPERPHRGYLAEPAHVEIDAFRVELTGSRYSRRRPRHSAYDPYDESNYDDRDRYNDRAYDDYEDYPDSLYDRSNPR